MWENVRICKKWRFIGGILQRESRYHTDVRGLSRIVFGGYRGNGVVLFFGKEGKRGSLVWLCEKRSFGDGCHSVLMGLSYSSYEALIQWR